jgi:tight adherence protein C
MVYLASALIFLALLFLSFAVLNYMGDRLNPATRRLLRMGNPSREQLLSRITRQREEVREGPGLFEKIKDRIMRFLASLTVTDIESLPQRERLRFSKAGIRGVNQVRIYLGIRTFLSVALLSIYLFYAILRQHPPLTILLMGTFSFILGRLLFNLLITSKIKKRNQYISRNVHDAIDLLMICLEAGLGLNVALLKVGENLRYINGTLAEEFLLLNHEVQAGSTRVEAYRNMRNRTDVRELRSLLTMLIQSETLGTSLGQVLRAYSDTLRTKIQQKAEERANKAGVKLAIPLVLFIFPPLFVVILGPAVLQAIRLLKNFIIR